MGKQSSKRSEPRLLGLQRDEMLKAKQRLAKTLTNDGIDWVEQIIRAGPWLEGGEEEDKARASQLFQWATTFAADRGGLPKSSALSVQGGGDAIPAITVNIVGHPRPADS